MGKGTPTNFFDAADWLGRSASWQGWDHNWSPKASKAPSPVPGTGAMGPSTTLTVTFKSEEAGYANAMGWYNSRTGEAGILFKNTNDDGWNAGVKAGDQRNLTVLQSDVDGNNIGFFLIPNGANELSKALLSSSMRFEVGRNGDGRIVIDRNHGHDVVLRGDAVLFSNQSHNKGDVDYVSGKVGTEGQTWAQKRGIQSDGPDGILGTMAWDDQSMTACGGTDRDFNDVVFTVSKSDGSNPPPNSPPNGAPTDITLSSAIISENVAGGAVGMLSTVDPSQGDKHAYSVSDDRFEVLDGRLKLKTGTSLNFEGGSSVQLKITATDKGGLNYSENFTIAVKNVNEEATDISISNVSVDENASGAAIGKLSTVDPDAGDKHTYSVSDGRFEVVDGQLRLRSGVSLDYEDKSSVQLKITTVDQGGLSYAENFTIIVKDVNEAPPNAAPTDIALSGASIDENVKGGSIGLLSTVDPNPGDTHTYTLSDARFEVVGNQLRLKIGESLDYETESSVALKITATDQDGLGYAESFTITVNDVNEAPPNAAPTDIALSGGAVAENLEGGLIGVLSTTDPNLGDTYVYAVDDPRFVVAGNQLRLKSGESLDYETESSVTLKITTTDQGGLGLSYSESFTIAVQDVNEAPTDISLSGLVVGEHDAGATIGTLSSVDDPGDTHQYSVDDARFAIFGNELRVDDNADLDHETQPTVKINVTSTDSSGNSLTKAFIISVNDLNEAPNAPVDSNPAADFVPENAPTGATVGITGASFDVDAGDSVTYSLSDDAGGLFAIDAATGVVTVAGGLDYDVATQHLITVRATDKQGEYGETDFTIGIGEDTGEFTWAYGSSGSDVFLLDLNQAVVNTLVGFDRTNDTLSFAGVTDTNANGVDLSDLTALVSAINDFGSGGDIVVDFSTGASLVFQGAGTGGPAPSLSGLVANPSTQFQFAQPTTPGG
jgi:hypothetical protein